MCYPGYFKNFFIFNRTDDEGYFRYFIESLTEIVTGSDLMETSQLFKVKFINFLIST